MKLTITTTDGSGLKIKHFDADTLLDLINDLDNAPEDQMMQFTLDEEVADVWIQKRHIVRVDVDHQDAG